MVDDIVLDPGGKNFHPDPPQTFSEEVFRQSDRIWQFLAECRSQGRCYPDLATLDSLTGSS